MTGKQFFVLWIYFLLIKTTVNATIVETPQLRLQTGVTPENGVTGGDPVSISAEISHSEKSHSDAVDVELSLTCPTYTMFKTYSSTMTPQSVTKHRNHEISLKFSNVSLSTQVTVTMPAVVDAYHVLTTREEMTASCMVTLWYYGVMDTCSRPASKWNARSTSNVVKFSLTAKAVCESELKLHESSFSASSFEKLSYQTLGNSPHRASFAQNMVWTPAHKNDINQYLQIELDQLMTITKVATKGNGDLSYPRYVRKFVVYHSPGGYDWSMAYAAFQSHEFDGNNDSTTVKMNTLKISIKAKILRIIPKLWKDKIALKVQLFGCSVHQVAAGFQPLGMASGRIKNNKITVLSGSTGAYKPYHARLNFNTGNGAWCTDSGSKQTLVIDLDVDYVIAEIVIQSRYQQKDKLIKTFKISYKKNGGPRTYIKQNANDKTFLGNPVEDTTIRHKFLEPILARNLYIEPTLVSSTGCARLELYGYKSGDEYISGYCTIFDFESDKSLMQWNKTGSAFDNQPTFFDNLYVRTGQASQHEGERWIGTRENRRHPDDFPGVIQGNHPTGSLTSPRFIISGSKLYFLFAGTADKAKARVELLVKGLVARTAFSQTGNESLAPMSWDVGELIGQEAQIRIVDSGSEAFVSFDGLKSNCHLREELLPVFERSFLLNRLNNTLYMCHFSHTRKRDDPICRLTSDNGLTWHDLNHVAGLLGVNEVTGELYGVSMDRRDRLVSRHATGPWYEIDASEWNKIEYSLDKMVEIPNIPATGLAETDERLSVLTLDANSGDSFSASSLGIYHRPSGGSWSMIATWRCKEYPDVCVSNPCNNAGTCNVTSDGGYNCTCPQGFTGDICDQVIDTCSSSPCFNDGQCVNVQGMNTFYCVCNSFYTGERCEKDIDDCAASQCAPGSVCIDGLGTFTCQCPLGYVGEFCQMEIDECVSMPCQNDGHCVDHVNSYKCHCRRGYSGTNCEHAHASAFEVINIANVVHDSSRYTVVHARIPRDGRSRHQTWCHDYAELCYSLDKKRPTGCGRSFNHITEIHQCQTFYGSVMSRNNTLGCPPNEKVSAVAKMAGFSNANSANSFAFSKCDSSECTDVLPISGCHGALHCINQAVTEVYTLCTDPDGNITHEDKTYGFSVLEEHWTVVDNVTFLAIKSRLPHERKSIQEDWCQDYAKLCESYGLRPTGSDIVQDHQYTSCRDKYGSVMMDGVLFGSTPKSKIASIAQQAGFASANVDNSFGLAKCTQCPSVLTNSHCEGLGCIKTSPHDDVYTVCVKLQSGFDVLERKTTAYNNTAYIVMKAKVMGNKLLNWRDEYTKTCSHYGGRNVVCKADFTTNSVQNSQPSTTQTPTTFNLRITSSPMSKAQHPRNSSVSSSQPNTTQTPTTLQFWTNFSTKYEAQDSKTGSVEHSPPTTTQYSNSFYLRTTSSPKSVPTIRSLFSSPALSTTMPIPSKTTSSPKSEQKIRSLFSSPALSTIMPIPSKTRAITSASYSWSNVDQRADLIDERIACSQLMPVAFNVGFSNATASNIYIPDSFKDSHAPSTEVVYLLCEGSDSNFDVISTKAAAVRGQEYLIVETKLPQNGLARYETWCEDYKQLCLSYGQRPLGCDKDSSGLSHTACRDNYDAMLPGFSAMTCPSNLGVIGLVNQVGYINGSVNNSFAFSVCNESTCTKEYGNAMALYAQVKLGNALAPKHQLYTMCAASNTSFTVESSKNVSYQGGAYKIIKARIPSKHISKQETWCNDYQSLCNSYGWRPVLTSHDADVSCERDYRAIKPLRDEVSSDKKLEYLVKIAGYENANVGNIFAFRKKCSDSCFPSISDFSQATEPALNLSSKLLSENNNVIFAVCMNSDTNFRVLDTGRINYHNRSYLVLKTKLASHGISKHENWCRDYQRLCEEHEMRPVTILSRESNPGSGGARVGTCVPDYMSIVVPRNESLNLFTREEISIMANLAGYREASRDNSFAFSECNPNSCSRLLNSKCTPGLDCLSSEPRQLYTVCVDSNSNFMAEKTRHIKHKGVPYLIVRSNIPKNGISRHQNWCLDYKALCNSFGMKPVLCENQQSVNNPQLSNCSLDFATTNNSCQLRNMDVLSKLIDESFLNGSSPFMPARCDICNETPNTIVLSVCTALPTSFNVLETRQADYHNARVTIVRTKVLSNGTSFHKNWGHDYNKMCLSLGKRPFSCYEARNAQQHNNREQYNIFLSHFENCSDIQTFKSLVIQAGFSHVNNLLLFQSSLIPGNRLIYNAVLSETAKSTNCSCSNPLVSLVQRNSTFSEIWRECVERRLEQGASLNLTQNCSVARDCLNGTQMANNSCDVILKCYYNNCTECCPLPLHQVHMSDCPTGKDCLDFNSTDEVYAFCSDYSASNFQVHDARDVVYADRPYTVVKAQIPTHGQSRSQTWCKDYKMLCQAMGKRPVGCGEDFEILKQSRDCRIHYDAIMMKEMQCPGSEKVADIAKHAGFPASVNESLGLWNCEICSKNFSETWNNISLNVYLLCAESDSNLKVLEKRVVQHQKSPVSVFMTTIPQHGQSFHENWCIDYSQLCRSYGLRPVGCGKSADNVKEHAQCRERYNALLYSDDSVDCSETFELYKIARSAGFSTAKAQNTFIFKSCLPQHCTKFLPSPEHPFTQFEVGSTDRVLYTLCASSDSGYDVIATKPIEIEKQDYLVIRAKIPVEGKSKHVNWCEDYKRLCEGYAMRPLSCEHTSNSQRLCIYDFGAVTKSNADLACPAKSGIASIAKQAGFDNVSDTNSFAMDWCDLSSSCVAKMPNRQCVDKTYYDPFFETNATQVNITRADYFVNTTKTVGNETIAFLDPRHCFILQSPKSGEPQYIIDGEKLTDIFKGNTCESNFDINGSLVTPTFFQLTANQTFEYQIPRVETECRFLTDNSLGRMSGEANTVCVRASSESSFEVQSTRTITSSGREYLIIQAKLLSALSKSTNWCMEYTNLCKAFQSSPLACPRRFGFNTDYVKCVSGYEAIMPSDVAHKCPSNGFVSDLARLAGYTRASQANSFSLSDCGDAKCTSKLPLTGCSHGVHCLNHEVLQDLVYTACVIANSDSNFNVIEKREKRLKNYDYTLIRARLPVNHAPLFESWCKDYERLCKSFDLRPIYCKGGGLSVNDYGVCKQKYSSVLSHSYDCPTKVYNMAKSAGFVGPNDINSFAFHQCSMCSENLQTTTCDKALNCLTTSVPDREVYTVCGDSKTLSGFQPLATKEVAHGHLRLRVIQAKVIRQSSTFSDWGYDYRNLCNLYNELPTGCGLIPGESNDGVSRCGSNYNSHVLKGNELGCNPNDVIAKLARDAGFVNARPNNSFGFSYCNVSAVSQLSSTCHGKLPCLTWTPENPIVYTVCAKKAIESNFKVMGTKSITFNRMDYLVIHAEIPKDGRSNKSNWCHDYKELCVAYDMLPTGCGGDNVRHQNYSSCSTQYDSYMPANDIHGCGDPKLVSNIAKKVGFKDAIPTNSFAFYNCHQCSRELTKECNGALNCISNIVWQRQVYTVCVRPTTAFNVRSTAVTFFDNSNYLVLEAKLPAEGKSISESWCRDYEKLCKSHNARPLFCHKDESYLESARRYTAKKSLLSCDGKDISNIAQQAGFSSAKQENTFILNNCHKCSKELVSSGCDGALSCIHSNPTGYVYAVCAKDNANFKIVGTQKLSISGDVYTVVSAVPATERASASWCHDYTELCHIIGQSPVALHSDVVTEQLLKCRDNYDAVIQKSAVDAVHQMANQAGYSGAEYGNTFAFKDCSEESCQSSPYSYNCSSSLYCLNGVAQKVWGLCIDNTPSSNFYMLEKKTLYANDTMYAVLKVRIPVHRLSKFDSWCRDYERLCHTHNMRPLTSLSSRECSIEYFGVYASKFNLQSLLAVVHLAGFSNATTSDVYSLQKCGAQECRKKFESTNQRRVFYAVCGSLDENAQTNFQVQTIRNVWYDAAFLVAHVRIPGHKRSKTKNWCLEYQTFCKAYDRQPYTSRNVSTKTTLDVCSWNYNATIYDTVISPGAIVERAGFTVTNQACVSSLYDCTHCARVLDKDKCPFEDCQAAVKTCNDLYIICT